MASWTPSQADLEDGRCSDAWREHMASGAPSEGEGIRRSGLKGEHSVGPEAVSCPSPYRAVAEQTHTSGQSPSESAYYACPGPCKRPRWGTTSGYCFNCGQRLIPVQTKERKV